MGYSAPALSFNYLILRSIVIENGTADLLQVHGTAVILDGQGILIRGPSGAGKSDLALKLIDGGGILVADDRVNLREEGKTVYMSAPLTLEGRLEIRGLGIIQVEFEQSIQLSLVCDLTPGDQIDRLPGIVYETVIGHPFPLMKIDGRTPSAIAKIRYALKVSRGEIGLIT